MQSSECGMNASRSQARSEVYFSEPGESLEGCERKIKKRPAPLGVEGTPREVGTHQGNGLWGGTIGGFYSVSSQEGLPLLDDELCPVSVDILRQSGEQCMV